MLRRSVDFSASCASRFDPHGSYIPSHSCSSVKVFAVAGLGFFIALAIGAAFIAIWFTQASNLWEKSEALWEGLLRRARSTVTRG